MKIDQKEKLSNTMIISFMAKMSDKTKRAINRGRKKAGLRPIKWGNKMTRKQTDREAFKRAGLTKRRRKY